MKWFSLIKKHPYRYAFSISTLLAATIMLVVFITCGYTPFGDKTLIAGDANIQYMDFFAYLHNVLVGNDTLDYTFNKGLGGSAIALFAYYLASPFNLLVVFFDVSSLPAFFSLLFIIKTALAAGTFSIFLTYKLKQSLTSRKKFLLLLLLSLSYGFNQFLLFQFSNIIWFDGVILLPLMLTAVSKLVDNRKLSPLILVVATNFLINWYTGCINCLFAGLWFIFELVNLHLKKSCPPTWSLDGKLCLKALAAVFLGVLCGAALFIPTLYGLLSSSHGSLEFGLLFNPSFIGEIPTLISGFSLGAESAYGQPSLYSSCLVIIGVVMLFVSTRLPRPQKLCFAAFLLILVLILFWQPFTIVFSLFENVASFWYRYNYGCIAWLIYFAAVYFINYMKREDAPRLLRVGLICSIILIITQFVRPLQDLNHVYYTAVILLIVSTILVCTIKYPTRRLAILILLAITVGELAYSASIYICRYSMISANEFAEYASDTQQLIDQLRGSSSDPYRISQTSSRFYTNRDEGLQANYNESLAYSYPSLATYVSLVDENQLDFLDTLGYRKDDDIKSVVNTSILGVDSLLGVKYVLSSYPINGLVLTSQDDTLTAGTKQVYRNPYALPLAFTYQSSGSSTSSTSNPFTYQNALYSELLGHPVELYTPVKYKTTQTSNSASSTREYTLDPPSDEKRYAIYGLISISDPAPTTTLNVDGQYSIAYGRSDGSLTPSVFYIPTSAGSQSTLQLDNVNPASTIEPQFYALDLNTLEKTTKTLLSRNKVQQSIFQHGSVEVSVADAEQGDSLFLSVAEDPNWVIKRNGELVEPNLFGDTLYSVPLVAGENTITLEYKNRPFRTGLIISLIGLLVFAGIVIYEYRRPKASAH